MSNTLENMFLHTAYKVIDTLNIFRLRPASGNATGWRSASQEEQEKPNNTESSLPNQNAYPIPAIPLNGTFDTLPESEEKAPRQLSESSPAANLLSASQKPTQTSPKIKKVVLHHDATEQKPQESDTHSSQKQPRLDHEHIQRQRYERYRHEKNLNILRKPSQSQSHTPSDATQLSKTEEKPFTPQPVAPPDNAPSPLSTVQEQNALNPYEARALEYASGEVNKDDILSSPGALEAAVIEYREHRRRTLGLIESFEDLFPNEKEAVTWYAKRELIATPYQGNKPLREQLKQREEAIAMHRPQEIPAIVAEYDEFKATMEKIYSDPYVKEYGRNGNQGHTK